jgi:ureidoglycolate dehydrogenase (NAD+)
MSTDTEIHVSPDVLLELGMRALALVGVAVSDARATMDVLLRADLRGVPTHGVQRLLTYVPRLRDGLINSRPDIIVESPAPAVRTIDGDNGLGPVVATRGMTEAITLARNAGIGFVGCRRSNHFGACAPYVLMACREKMIGIAGANSSPTMAPWGGLTKLIGNNPLAIGVPCEGEPSFVIDIAMSNSSRARIFNMAAKKEKIPGDWALDAKGRPTTDASEAIKGFVLPIGRHKGYGLAVAIDILSGVLTGGAFSRGLKSLAESWNEPQSIGHFFIAVDATRFMPWEVFSERMKDLFAGLRGAQRIDPETSIFVPGERGAQTERDRQRNGVPIAPRLLETLKGLAEGNYDYDIPKF